MRQGIAHLVGQGRGGGDAQAHAARGHARIGCGYDGVDIRCTSLNDLAQGAVGQCKVSRCWRSVEGFAESDRERVWHMAHCGVNAVGDCDNGWCHGVHLKWCRRTGGYIANVIARSHHQGMCVGLTQAEDVIVRELQGPDGVFMDQSARCHGQRLAIHSK